MSKGVIQLDETQLELEEARLLANIKSAKSYKEEINKDFRTIDLFYSSRYVKLMKNNEPWREIPTSNIMKSIHSVQFNNLSKRKWSGKITPVLGNPALNAMSVLVNSIFQNVLESVDVTSKINNAINDGILYGTSITYVGYNDNPFPVLFEGGDVKKNLQVININPTQFLINESATDIANALFCCTLSRINVSEALKTFNNPDELEKLYTLFEMESMSDEEKLFATKYSSSGAIKTQGDLTDFGQVYDRDYENQVGNLLYQVYYELVNNNGKNELHTYYMIEKKIIRYTVSSQTKFPFAVFRSTRLPQSFWGQSDMLDIASIQKMIVKLDAIIGVWTIKFDKPLTIVSTKFNIPTANLAKDLGAMGGILQVNTDNPSNVLTHVVPPALPDTLILWRRELKAQAYEQSNVNQFTMGANKNTGVKTGAATIQQDNSVSTDSVRIDNLRAYTKDLYKLILDATLEIINGLNFKKLKAITVPNDSYFFTEGGKALQNVQKFELKDFDKEVIKRFPLFMRLQMDQRLEKSPEQVTAEVKELITMQAQGGANFKTPLITEIEALELLDLPNRKQIVGRMAQERIMNASGSKQKGFKAIVDIINSSQSSAPDTLDPANLTADNMEKAYDSGQKEYYDKSIK